MAQGAGHDAFPDNFDIGRLAGPSLETELEFAKALATLEPFATERSSTSIEVRVGDPDSNDLFVSVYCARGAYKDTQGNETPNSSLNVSGYRGDERFLINAGYKSDDRTRDRLGGLYDELIEGIPEKEATWLREVWAEAQVEDEDVVPGSVYSLLGKAPYPVGEHTLHYMKTDFNDGTSINGDWITGNDAFVSEFPADMTLQTLFITAPDGRQFEYSRYGDGREEIFIKIKGETVVHEVTVPSEVTADSDTGLSISVRGDAAFMRAMQTAIAERAEARKSGSVKPTDGSVGDMTKVINEAVASGLKKDHTRG